MLEMLNSMCDGIDIVNLPNQPFEGKLIDATIIVGKKKCMLNSRPTFNEISFERLNYVSGIKGFDKMSNLFFTKRGLRLKQADFFLTDVEKMGSTPFIKKVNNIRSFEVPQDYSGAALLITQSSGIHSQLSVKAELLARLKSAQEYPDSNIPILKWYKDRPDDWFVHAEPPTATLLFNYYLRSRPKHMLSPGIGYSDNFYGLRCLKGLPKHAWLAILNSTIFCIELLSHARNQGNGLAKLQLFEYRNCFGPDLSLLSKREIDIFEKFGFEMINGVSHHEAVIKKIDSQIFNIFGDDTLNPNTINEIYNHVSSLAKNPKELSK